MFNLSCFSCVGVLFCCACVVNGICSLQHDFMLTIFPNEVNLYDLALCIDNNDNHVTFVGHIVYLCPS